MANEQPADEGLDPLGLEFWLGQTITLFGVAMGILLSARIGFNEASRVSRYEDVRLARDTVAAVGAEVAQNVESLRRARDRVRAGGSARVQLSTTYLEAATQKGYMAAVNPVVIADAEQLFAPPIPEIAERLEGDPLMADERTYILGVLDETIERADIEVVPAFGEEVRALDALATEIKDRI